jgi:hypothetical protein
LSDTDLWNIHDGFFLKKKKKNLREYLPTKLRYKVVKEWCSGKGASDGTTYPRRQSDGGGWGVDELRVWDHADQIDG